jgi:ferrous iron transport protein A
MITNITLNQVPLGQAFLVESLEAQNEADILQMEAIGFLPSEQVMVLNKGLFKGDALVVRVGVSTFALRPTEAEMVRLKPIVEENDK